MKKHFHKLATYTAFIVISAQPLSAKAFASEKAHKPSISITEDSDYFSQPQPSPAQIDTPTLSDAAPSIAENSRPAPNPFHPIRYVSAKLAQFVAWFNTDIEADLH